MVTLSVREVKQKLKQSELVDITFSVIILEHLFMRLGKQGRKTLNNKKEEK